MQVLVTDFFGSVRNVELHNDTQLHDKERFAQSFVVHIVYSITLVYLHMILKLDHMILELGHMILGQHH